MHPECVLAIGWDQSYISRKYVQKRKAPFMDLGLNTNNQSNKCSLELRRPTAYEHIYHTEFWITNWHISEQGHVIRARYTNINNGVHKNNTKQYNKQCKTQNSTKSKPFLQSCKGFIEYLLNFCVRYSNLMLQVIILEQLTPIKAELLFNCTRVRKWNKLLLLRQTRVY